MSITCYIIDDEPPAIRILEHYIGQVPQLELLGSATDPLEGMQAIQKKKPQLLFLDINMPKLSGISLLKSLPESPMVIFTTAYPEYALEGFELEAIDYLLKPFPFERFLKAVNKVQRLFNSEGNNKTVPYFLFLKVDRRLFRIPYEEIILLQAYGDYVKLYTTSQTLLPKITLAQLEQELPASLFIRTHRSYIISLAHLKFLEGNYVQVETHRAPIGRAFREALLEHIGPR